MAGRRASKTGPAHFCLRSPTSGWSSSPSRIARQAILPMGSKFPPRRSAVSASTTNDRGSSSRKPTASSGPAQICGRKARRSDERRARPPPAFAVRGGASEVARSLCRAEKRRDRRGRNEPPAPRIRPTSRFLDRRTGRTGGIPSGACSLRRRRSFCVAGASRRCGKAAAARVPKAQSVWVSARAHRLGFTDRGALK